MRSSLIIVYISVACSFFAFSSRRSIFAVTILGPKRITSSSPDFTLVPGFAVTPFTAMRPFSATSFATVRLLISRDTFKYLSNRMVVAILFTYFILIISVQPAY
ncbi:ribosomal RNA binding protein involved in 50S [Listeria monocytogenes]|nr:ribosomal RNA binding protein involved in 50S [Listeria monocytogenes]